MPTNEMMKAVIYNEHGGPDVLHLTEVAKPAVGADQVLIKVAATTYNPVDAAIRSGFFPIPVPLPAIPGSEVAGTIEALGDKVTGLSIGDEVIVELLPAQGGAAQYAVAPAANVVHAPKSVDLVDAAAIPLVSQTAYQGLFVHGKAQPGQRVLIVGAGGAVGGVAVQLAHNAGAHVIATASGKDITRVKELGADEVVDYKAANFLDQLKEAVDAVVAFAPADLSIYYPLIKEGGILVSAASPTDNAPETIQTIRLMGQNDPQLLAKLVKMVDNGEFSVPIAEHGTLEDVAAVHANPPHSGKAIFKVQ